MSYLEIGYNITTDPNYLDEQNAITPELRSKLGRYYRMSLEGKRTSIKKLLNAIEQYPDNPQLKNHLSVLYGNLNEYQKMYDVNKWIIAEHPNYLFGKINLANEYYIKQEYDKMLEALGSEMEIKSLYPDRDTFHLIEVISFFKTAILYFTAIGDIKQAKIRYDIMQELAPDSHDTELARYELYRATMKAAHDRLAEDQKSKITVKRKPQEITSISEAPKFNHQEMEWLYNNGLYIGEEKLNTILSLPNNSLIEDLELIIQDSINRYGYFNTMLEENGWDEAKFNFVIHALFLLGELKATQSMEAVFKVLSQSEEYIELYIGDFLTSSIWEVVYNVAHNNLEACKEFMYRPGINVYSRALFPQMVNEVVFHYPERRSEVLEWYRDVLQFFLESTIEDNVIDSDVIAFTISYLSDINGQELLPEIKKMFDRGLVSTSICGDLDELMQDIAVLNIYNIKKDIPSITERYKEVTTNWAGYTEREKSMEFDDEPVSGFNDEYFFEPVTTLVRSEHKIGRNDPCPCGSTKKYKKCCLRK